SRDWSSDVCSSDLNINRTVANIRSYFSKHDGSLGTSGMLNFIFERKGIFRIDPSGLDMEELELELIDYGAEEVFEDEGELIIYTQFEDFGKMQKAVEERQLNDISSELQRFTLSLTEVTPEQEEELN